MLAILLTSMIFIPMILQFSTLCKEEKKKTNMTINITFVKHTIMIFFYFPLYSPNNVFNDYVKLVILASSHRFMSMSNSLYTSDFSLEVLLANKIKYNLHIKMSNRN